MTGFNIDFSGVLSDHQLCQLSHNHWPLLPWLGFSVGKVDAARVCT